MGMRGRRSDLGAAPLLFVLAVLLGPGRGQAARLVRCGVGLAFAAGTVGAGILRVERPAGVVPGVAADAAADVDLGSGALGVSARPVSHSAASLPVLASAARAARLPTGTPLRP